MKKYICLLLLACFLLSACSPFGDRLAEPVTFYYVQSEYPYGQKEGVISGELREASGHRDSLPYLMAIYFLGPIDEELHSVFPRSTVITSINQQEGVLQLTISDTSVLTDVDFSLGCACLTMTCLEITDAQSVTITSGSRSITMSRDNLTLLDSHTGAVTEDTK